MNNSHIARVARELKIEDRQASSVAELLDGGATVPFIARYRKEATGSLDEVAVTAIRDRLEELGELEKRRDSIVASLTERDLLTDDLEDRIQACETMAELEDVYLPFRPKRRTRAMIAREKGLESLASILMLQDPKTDPRVEAERFINPDKSVGSVEDALTGARDIIAEMISEDAGARAEIRRLFGDEGAAVSTVVKGQEEEGAKYRDYFDWNEPIRTAPSHRILAMFRGEKEGFLRLKIAPKEERALDKLMRSFSKKTGRASDEVESAVEDGYKRLLGPSMETEIRADLRKRADAEAIRVFSENVRELLMSSPLGEKNLLAIDPGFRTGCKVVCLNRQGKLLRNDTVYPHTGEGALRKAEESVRSLCAEFDIEVIAIGNGTAGRETEAFIRSLGLARGIPVVMVNESGASIYSASEAAREEFPDYDLTVRGAVSIGRRLMDPLAELVKIDPKSIGVGQYQHDVDQSALKRSLDDTVVICVNRVGVDVNTASRQLLSYVSGLGPQLAKNIISYRDENGAFPDRKSLRKVKGLGPKAFEQAAGFLRVRNGRNPLDGSSVHPESYGIVDKMSADLGCKVVDLLRDETLRKEIELKKYVDEKVGLPTLRDIVAELAKPGRDPREEFELFEFAEGVEKMDDLVIGMSLPGIVTNVTAFGAFVDVGVHQDGLVHISQLADKFVKDPSEVVKVQQRVRVTVVGVDIPRKRISLSMKKNPIA